MAIIKRSVEQILSSFNKIVKELEEVEAHSIKGADDATKVIEQKEKEKSEHLAEAQRASAVRKKISDLVSP